MYPDLDPLQARSDRETAKNTAKVSTFVRDIDSPGIQSISTSVRLHKHGSASSWIVL